MRFTDRVTLGIKLAEQLNQLRGNDAVILCLKESSLLMCLTMAKELRAWVYPPLYVPVYSQDGNSRLLGAVAEDLAFVPNPEALDTDGNLSDTDSAFVEAQRVVSIGSLKQMIASYDMEVDKHLMDGRDVVIAGDVVTNSLPVWVALRLLDSIRPKSISFAIGNASASVAETARIMAPTNIVLDILSGVISEDDKYFEHADEYNVQQKQQLTKYIASYWQ